MPTCTPEPTAVSSGPPSSSALMRHYAALDGASKDMLQAARAGDWDTVCRIEGACAVVIARMRLLGRERPLTPEEQRERMRILRAIVLRDAEIRRICDPASAAFPQDGWPLVEAGTTLH